MWDPETNLPLGFPANAFPGPQGPYYCCVGAKFAYGRDIIESLLDLCLDAGLNVEGINAEVASGQWEYQVFAKGAKEAGDHDFPWEIEANGGKADQNLEFLKKLSNLDLVL